MNSFKLIFFVILTFSVNVFAAPSNVIQLSDDDVKRFDTMFSNLEKQYVENIDYVEKSFPLREDIWEKVYLEHGIPVCWENLKPGNKFSRDIVEKAIANTWEANSSLRFTGWEQCSSDNIGIRILIKDIGPKAILGRKINKVKNGMILNDTYKIWGEPCSKNNQELTKCIYRIAVHEFGHALGFAHEQNRSDTPGECLKKLEEEEQSPEEDRIGIGDASLTPLDKESVMNYCNLKYANHGKLSKWDAYVLRKLYGNP